MSGSLHEGHRSRMRERFVKGGGLDFFADHEVLELLLYYCVPQRDTNKMAHRLINEFGGLANLFDAHPLDIARRCHISENTAILIGMVPHLAKRYFHGRWKDKARLVSPGEAGGYLVSMFTGRNKEAFYILCMDAQRGLISAELVNEGTIDEAPIYIRNIVEKALQRNAVSVVLSHNHPGGTLQASGADIEATRQIIRAFEAIGINVLDHIVVAGGKYFSFAENGGLLGLRY